MLSILIICVVFFFAIAAIVNIIQILRNMLASALSIFFKMFLLIAAMGMAIYFYYQISENFQPNAPPAKAQTFGNIPKGLTRIIQKESPSKRDDKIIKLIADDGKEYLLTYSNGQYILATSPNSFKKKVENVVQYQVLSPNVWDFDAPVSLGRRQLKSEDGSKYALVYSDKKWFLYKAKNSQRKLNFEKEPTIRV